jgi:hypothetical protein
MVALNGTVAEADLRATTFWTFLREPQPWEGLTGPVRAEYFLISGSLSLILPAGYTSADSDVTQDNSIRMHAKWLRPQPQSNEAKSADKCSNSRTTELRPIPIEVVKCDPWVQVVPGGHRASGSTASPIQTATSRALHRGNLVGEERGPRHEEAWKTPRPCRGRPKRQGRTRADSRWLKLQETAAGGRHPRRISARMRA